MRLVVVGSLLTLLAFSAAPCEAGAPPASQDAQRARKAAARRFGGQAVSLPVSAFASGLKVCVRDAPSGIAGYWKVPAKVVDAADAELLLHLRKSGLLQRLPFSPKLYVRQYVGFVRDGVRHLYVHAVLVEKKSRLAAEVQKSFPGSCADVSGAWGIQYDTKSRQFTGFTSK